MYQVSRAIYRELSRDVVGGRTAHEHVLRACESTVERLVADRHYFARPARWLFQEVRPYVAFPAQGRAWLVVERYLGCAEQLLAELPRTGVDANGNPLQCRATTRRGHALPAAPAARERLLPLAPAPGRHGGPRPGRRAARRLTAPPRRPRGARAGLSGAPPSTRIGAAPVPRRPPSGSRRRSATSYGRPAKAAALPAGSGPQRAQNRTAGPAGARSAVSPGAWTTRAPT